MRFINQFCLNHFFCSYLRHNLLNNMVKKDINTCHWFKVSH